MIIFIIPVYLYTTMYLILVNDNHEGYWQNELTVCPAMKIFIHTKSICLYGFHISIGFTAVIFCKIMILLYIREFRKSFFIFKSFSEIFSEKMRKFCAFSSLKKVKNFLT